MKNYVIFVGKGGGAGGPAKGLAPAHYFPLEGTDCSLLHATLIDLLIGVYNCSIVPERESVWLQVSLHSVRQVLQRKPPY